MFQSFWTGKKTTEKIYGVNEEKYKEFFQSCKENNLENVRKLINEGYSEVESEKDNVRPLVACSFSTEILKELLDEDVDVNYQDKNGISILHKLAYDGDYKKLNMVLEKGGDIMLKTKQGHLPFDYSRLSRNYNVMGAIRQKMLTEIPKRYQESESEGMLNQLKDGNFICLEEFDDLINVTEKKEKEDVIMEKFENLFLCMSYNFCSTKAYEYVEKCHSQNPQVSFSKECLSIMEELQTCVDNELKRSNAERLSLTN
jgi:hypothetical protein